MSRITAFLFPAVVPFALGGTTPFVDPGPSGADFLLALGDWTPGTPWCEDENFFISRVCPAARFRNQATQIDPTLDEESDKKLIFWVPAGDETHPALPGGNFDSETFTQWSYVTHYGVWNMPPACVPAGLMDAAHRNGVAVSAVAAIPFGPISPEWERALREAAGSGAEKMAAWLNRCGLDGIGYNSEFTADPSLIASLGRWHGELRTLMASPLKEIIWYDGTSEFGYPMFDLGLGTHNDEIWGGGGDVRTSLFFNYNWNYPETLERSVEYAREMGRTPLDLYCGINMQGREPHDLSRGLWSLLRRYPLSIGLWGAHSANMFWESRGECGGSAEGRQRHYLSGIERWFCGGTRNPLTSRRNGGENIAYGPGNDDFPGMSSMMTARSPLSWDLSERPFITSFCLGNGMFLNKEGMCCHDSQWYDLGAQDYLPTWTWWWAGEWLGRDGGRVPVEGMEAEYTHDDAWTGGSSVRIYGSAANEWLHLFKTQFGIGRGDQLSVCLKHVAGAGRISLVLCAEDHESEPVEVPLDVTEGTADWQRFTLYPGLTEGTEFLSGKTLAMMGLRFTDAEELDIRLGNIELTRPGGYRDIPAAPVIERAEVMEAGPGGAVGKIIFNMPDESTKGPYNLDHGVSRFNLYARQPGGEPQLRGMTSVWAALLYGIPGEWERPDAALEMGVAAVGLDGHTESPVSWSGPLSVAPVFDPGPPVQEIPAPGFEREYGAPPVIESLSVTSAATDGTLSVEAVADVPSTTRSRGVRIGECGYGFTYADAGIVRSMAPHSVSFMIRPDAPADTVPRTLFTVRDRSDVWSDNHFGSFRHTISADGTTSAFVLTGSAGGDAVYYFDETPDTRLYPGEWHHMIYTFETDEAGGVRPRWYLDGKERKPVRRVRGRTTVTGDEMPFEKRLKSWRPGNVGEVGGYVHGAVAMEGSVACMKFHSDPVTDEETAGRIMADTSSDSIMAPVAYRDTGVEGVGELYRPRSEYTAGPPMDFGEDFPLATDVRWRVYGGRLLSTQREEDAGKLLLRAEVEAHPGCRIELTASNEFGTDSSSIIPEISAVSGPEEGVPEVWPRVFEDAVHIRMSRAGRWTITLTDTSGKILLVHTLDLRDGQEISLYPDAAAGILLLTLTDERGNVSTVKLMRK
ncbi:MAG: hypothetical protein K2O24_08360 [Muribaculaceae bacterium]|nr:hypothetical protein [Muribaculaceae bacterium]